MADQTYKMAAPNVLEVHLDGPFHLRGKIPNVPEVRLEVLAYLHCRSKRTSGMIGRLDYD